MNLELQEYNLQLIAAESKYRDTITAHDNVLREFKNKLTAADIDKAQLILDKELLKTQCDQLRNENNEIRFVKLAINVFYNLFAFIGQTLNDLRQKKMPSLPKMRNE